MKNWRKLLHMGSNEKKRKHFFSFCFLVTFNTFLSVHFNGLPLGVCSLKYVVDVTTIELNNKGLMSNIWVLSEFLGNGV